VHTDCTTPEDAARLCRVLFGTADPVGNARAFLAGAGDLRRSIEEGEIESDWVDWADVAIALGAVLDMVEGARAAA
jgi:hypothetical protein